MRQWDLAGEQPDTRFDDPLGPAAPTAAQTIMGLETKL